MTNNNAKTEPFELTHSRVKQFFIRDLWTTDLERLDPLRQWGYRVLRLLTVAVWEFQDGVLSLRAMSLVYTTILSLVPFLALTFSVLKAFGVHQQMEPLLAQALEPLGSKGSEVTAQIIEFVNNIQVGVLGILGIALLFYTTISLLEKVESAFNAIWRVRRHRTFARKFSDYLSVVLVGPVLVFSGFALMASAQSHWLVQRALEIDPLGSLFVIMARLMPFVLVCAAFTFLYQFIPHTKVRLACHRWRSDRRDSLERRRRGVHSICCHVSPDCRRIFKLCDYGGVPHVDLCRLADPADGSPGGVLPPKPQHLYFRDHPPREHTILSRMARTLNVGGNQ